MLKKILYLLWDKCYFAYFSGFVAEKIFPKNQLVLFSHNIFWENKFGFCRTKNLVFKNHAISQTLICLFNCIKKCTKMFFSHKKYIPVISHKNYIGREFSSEFNFVRQKNKLFFGNIFSATKPEKYAK